VRDGRIRRGRMSLYVLVRLKVADFLCSSNDHVEFTVKLCRGLKAKMVLVAVVDATRLPSSTRRGIARRCGCAER
jgi:hypothetical protein